MGEENFLEHTYHDSILKAMERKGEKLTLVIDTDIFLYPGKPFTFLTMTHVDDYSRAKELVGGSKYSTESIYEAKMLRSEKHGKNFRLQMDFHSGRSLEVHCYNFWTERQEEYKDYHKTIFR